MRPSKSLVWIIAIGLLAHLPCLAWGFFCDDYGQQLVLSGESGHGTMTPTNVYDFGEAPQPGEWAHELGLYPWWTDADWKIRFFRPMTSASLALDRALFDDWAPGHHLSGLVLFTFLLIAAHGLYRALGLSATACALATLVLALEDGTALPVGWSANRNSLVEALFAAWAMLVVARAERVTWKTAALALLLALGATLAKESGVVILMLVGMALLWRGNGAVPARAGAAVAFVSAACYPAALTAAGYGARSLFYPAPWVDPLLFLERVILTIPGAPASMVSPFALDGLYLWPQLRWWALVGALLAAPGVLWLTRRAYRDVTLARPLIVATCLTLLPQASAPPSDRLFLVPLITFAGLVGMALAAGWNEARRRFEPGHLALLALLALPVSGLSLFVRGCFLAVMTAEVRSVVTDAEVGPSGSGPRDAVLLNSPSQMAALSPLPTWIGQKGDPDLRLWPMQLCNRGLVWTRTGPRTFTLESLDGPFRSGSIEAVFLSRPPTPGGHFHTPLFDVTIAPDRLDLLEVTMKVDLDDAHLRFLSWDGERMSRITPPSLGQSATIPKASRLSPLLP